MAASQITRHRKFEISHSHQVLGRVGCATVQVYWKRQSRHFCLASFDTRLAPGGKRRRTSSGRMTNIRSEASSEIVRFHSRAFDGFVHGAMDCDANRRADEPEDARLPVHAHIHAADHPGAIDLVATRARFTWASGRFDQSNTAITARLGPSFPQRREPS
jgi:hypothetical protein